MGSWRYFSVNTTPSASVVLDGVASVVAAAVDSADVLEDAAEAENAIVNIPTTLTFTVKRIATKRKA